MTAEPPNVRGRAQQVECEWLDGCKALRRLLQLPRPRRNRCFIWREFKDFCCSHKTKLTIQALLPYLTHYYDLSYTQVSLVFLPALVGYLGSAALNERLHLRLGRRGIAIIGPICHLVTFVTAALHPPYAVLLVAIAFSGFGNGILDAAWNAWIGEMPKANEFMGILHSLYGVGATISPLVATAMITRGHTEWFAFYYVLVGRIPLRSNRY